MRRLWLDIGADSAGLYTQVDNNRIIPNRTRSLSVLLHAAFPRLGSLDSLEVSNSTDSITWDLYGVP